MPSEARDWENDGILRPLEQSLQGLMDQGAQGDANLQSAHLSKGGMWASSAGLE